MPAKWPLDRRLSAIFTGCTFFAFHHISNITRPVKTRYNLRFMLPEVSGHGSGAMKVGYLQLSTVWLAWCHQLRGGEGSRDRA